MSIVAQSPSHRGEIAKFFIHDAATLLLRSALPSYALYALTTTLLGPCYDLATTNALPRRQCYLGIVNFGASVTLPIRSWRSGQLQTLFKCFPKVGVALLDSRTNSERFHSHVIEE